VGLQIQNKGCGMSRELRSPAQDRPMTARVLSVITVFSALLLSLAHGAHFSGEVISSWAGGGGSRSIMWAMWHALGLVMCSVSLYGALYLPRRDKKGARALYVGAVWQIAQALLGSWLFPVIGVLSLIVLRSRSLRDFMSREDSETSESISPLV
jgi:hypothetical protein